VSSLTLFHHSKTERTCQTKYADSVVNGTSSSGWSASQEGMNAKLYYLLQYSIVLRTLLPLSVECWHAIAKLM